MLNLQKSEVTAFVTILVVTCLVIVAAADDRDQPVHFSLMVSSASTLDTSGVVSAVNQTLELINNDTTILSGYNLQYSRVVDTQVRQGFQFCSL